MGYVLGIDLGTTWTAAAVKRDDRVDIVGLGNRHAVVPSVVFLRDDEEVLIGEAAQRRAATEPDRIAREFKRRIGDPTPILVGTTPYSAEALSAKVLRWVADRVAELEGGPADHVVVTHPANWGPYKQDLFAQAIRIADLGGHTTMTTEPEAAALYYASNERVETGSVVAVFDLGGGTFDAAILRKSDDGFAALGQPEGIERLGGIDFDEAVFQHVMRSLGDAVEGLDPDDPQVSAAVARVRQECVEAKEALAGDTDVSIPIVLPNLSTEVRLTRGEFESMIRPSLADTIGAMRRAISGAGLGVDDVGTVLLVGGSSRIPLVAQMVGSELGRPVAVDAHPKYAVAMGAALAAEAEHGGVVVAPVAGAVDPDLAGDDSTHVAGAAVAAGVAGAGIAAAAASPAPPPEPPVVEPTEPVPVAPTQVMPEAAAVAAAGAATVAQPPVAPPPAPPPGAPASAGGDDGDSSRTIKLVLAAVLVIVAIGLGFMAFSGGDGGDAAEDTTTTEVLDTTTTESPITTTEPPETTTTVPVAEEPPPETTSTTEPCTGLMCLFIDDITITPAGEYSIEFTSDFPPMNTEGGNHAHIYFSPTNDSKTVSAGLGGVWAISDTSPDIQLKVADKPADATEICMTAANSGHVVIDTLTFDCFPIPTS